MRRMRSCGCGKRRVANRAGSCRPERLGGFGRHEPALPMSRSPRAVTSALDQHPASAVAPAAWNRKHLLGLEELSAEEIVTILDTAEQMGKISLRSRKKVPTL